MGGLQYKVLKSGSGIYHPKAGTPIDGTEFDSSYKRGSPTTFAPNQVIKGWTEAMQLMVDGDKWEMYIPSELAYGESGSPPKIPGGSVLVFKMEILKINGDKKLALTCEADGTGCNEKEKAFIEKQKGKSKEDLDKETARLEKMKGGKMKPELMEWVNRRLHVLGKLTAKA